MVTIAIGCSYRHCGMLQLAISPNTYISKFQVKSSIARLKALQFQVNGFRTKISVLIFGVKAGVKETLLFIINFFFFFGQYAAF